MGYIPHKETDFKKYQSKRTESYATFKLTAVFNNISMDGRHPHLLLPPEIFNDLYRKHPMNLPPTPSSTPTAHDAADSDAATLPEASSSTQLSRFVSAIKVCPRQGGVQLGLRHWEALCEACGVYVNKMLLTMMTLTWGGLQKLWQHHLK